MATDTPDVEEFPVKLDPDATTSGADLESFPCPDCDYVADSKFRLGQHRYAKHGYRSGSSTRKTEKRKGKAKATAKAPRKPRGESQAAILAEVETSLAEAMTKGGAMVYPALPIPAGYAIATGDEFAAIVTRIASRNPKLLARLRTSSDVMDYFALGTWGVGMVVAVGVNFGRLPADGPLARQWEIDVIASEYLAEAQARAAAEGETAPDGSGDGEPIATMGNGDGSPQTVGDSPLGAI